MGLVYLGFFLSIACAFLMVDFEPTKNNEYCENVEVFKQTKGEYGWPDYKEIYDEQCKK